MLGREDLRETSWETEARWERRRSTVFRLRPEGAAELAAYYKQSLSPISPTGELDDHRVAEIRLQFERSFALSRRLGIVCRDEPVNVAQSLAVDPDRMIEITLAVDGVSYANATGGRRRPAAPESIRAIGRAAHLIESASPQVSAQPVAWNQLEQALNRTGRWLSSTDRRRVLEDIDELHRRLQSEGWPTSYVHGDFSRGNILLSGASAGLIDFKWVPRYVGFDLAYFSIREASPWSLVSRRSPITEYLLQGYGDEKFDSSTPWRFHRIQFLVRLLGGDFKYLTRAPGARRQLTDLLLDT